MRRMIWLLIGVSGLLLLASIPAVFATDAPAASAVQTVCAITGCNGTDPYTTGCAGQDASYWVVDSVPVLWQGQNAGWVQLWWSQTCGTNWARYLCSRLCRLVSLVLLRCAPDGVRAAMPDLASLSETGRTAQYYLPETRAAAALALQVNAQAYAQASTGCY